MYRMHGSYVSVARHLHRDSKSTFCHWTSEGEGGEKKKGKGGAREWRMMATRRTCGAIGEHHRL